LLDRNNQREKGNDDIVDGIIKVIDNPAEANQE